jgi:hypothetical protein
VALNNNHSLSYCVYTLENVIINKYFNKNPSLSRTNQLKVVFEMREITPFEKKPLKQFS